MDTLLFNQSNPTLFSFPKYSIERSMSSASSSASDIENEYDFTRTSIDRFLIDNGLSVDEDHALTLTNPKSKQSAKTIHSENSDCGEEASNVLESLLLDVSSSRVSSISHLSSSSHSTLHPSVASNPTSSNNSSDVSGAGWTKLNTLLSQYGISNTTSVGQVTDVVRDLLNQNESRGAVITDMVLESSTLAKASKTADAHLAADVQHKKKSDGNLHKAQIQINELNVKLKEQKGMYKTQLKESAAAQHALKVQLKASEFRVVAKEKNLEKVQTKIMACVDKERAAKLRDLDVFRKLEHREARSSSGKDQKLLDFIRMFENQREALQCEIKNLQGQNRAMVSEIREKENCSDIGSPSSRAGKENTSQAFLQRMEQARRAQEAAAVELRAREVGIVKKVHRIERDLQLSHTRIVELEEENTNLEMELKSRPSLATYRKSTKRVEQLERQLSTQTQALADAKDLTECRKLLDTKSTMRKDKENHSLQLNRLQAVPKTVLLELVQTVCRILRLTDLTLIGPSIEKLCKVVHAVPRLESFVKDIQNVVRYDPRTIPPLESVLPLLQTWKEEMKALRALQTFRQQMSLALKERPFVVNRQMEWEQLFKEKKEQGGEDVPAPHSQQTWLSLDQMVTWSSELVSLERQWLTQHELYEQATARCESRPELLVHRLIHHFQYLFQVKSLQGVLPKLNSTYLFVTEMQSFLKKMRSEMNLNTTTTATTVLEMIMSSIHDKTISTSTHKNVVNNNSTNNYVVGRRDETPLVGVQEVRAMKLILSSLQKEVGATGVDDVLPRVKRLMIMLTEMPPAEET